MVATNVVSILLLAISCYPAAGMDNKTSQHVNRQISKDEMTLSTHSLTGIDQACASDLCKCHFGSRRTRAVCSGPRIIDIPEDLPLNITDLTFKQTKLRRIGGINISTSQGDFIISQLHKYKRLIHIFFTKNTELEHITAGAFEFPDSDNDELIHLSIQGSRKLAEIPFGALGSMKRLSQLHITGCGLTKPPDWSLLRVNHDTIITEINLNDNKIEKLDAFSFYHLTANVGILSLENNGISSISDGTFANVHISQIKLARNTLLVDIENNAFFDCKGLHTLDISDSNIQSLPTNGLEHLEMLRLENLHTLKKFPSVLKLQSINEVRLTYPQHCCAFAHPEQQDKEEWQRFVDEYESVCENNLTTTPPAGNNQYAYEYSYINNANDNANYYHYDDYEEVWISGVTIDPYKEHRILITCGEIAPLKNVQCTPQPDAFNPCEDLMGTWYLRISVWIILTFGILGNSTVLFVMMSSKHKITVQNFLMCNLAFADLLLGIYLLMIASADASTTGSYFTHAIPWQYQGGCDTAGFLAIFATNLSVFTLMTITIERWYAIRHAIHLSKRLKLKRAFLIMSAIWVYSILMAGLPFLTISSYKITSICLPMRANYVLDQLYLGFMLTCDAGAFVIICLCYYDMYRRVRGNESVIGINDAKIARKMAVLIFTDFLCIFPITFFGLTAALGKPLITVSQSKNLLVFFFPINSWLNPVLYAIITKQFRKDFYVLLSKFGVCERRAARYKYAFSSNQISTNSKNSMRGGQAYKIPLRNNKDSSHSQYKNFTNNDFGSDMTTQTSLSKSRDSAPMLFLNGLQLLESEEPSHECQSSVNESSLVNTVS